LLISIGSVRYHQPPHQGQGYLLSATPIPKPAAMLHQLLPCLVTQLLNVRLLLALPRVYSERTQGLGQVDQITLAQ